MPGQIDLPNPSNSHLSQLAAFETYEGLRATFALEIS
jgi:hypothetical protein